jgi:hypothetical protein
MEARASVMVQFVDSNTDSSSPVLVAASKVWFEFTDDAGNYEILRAECMDDSCTEWVLGYERPGTYEIHALVCGREYTSRAITVGMTEDGCHVETEWVKMNVDSSTCRPDALASVDDLRSPDDPACTLESHPSAIVMPVLDGGDVYLPYPTEQLWFEHGDTRHKAVCASELEANGECSRWITGWELDGRFKAYTETCDVVTEIEYEVGRTVDGCHVETAYVPVFMDTHGCIQSPQPKFDPIPVLTR